MHVPRNMQIVYDNQTYSPIGCLGSSASWTHKAPIQIRGMLRVPFQERR